MRTAAETRALGVGVPNKDSLYKPIERQPRRFNKLHVSAALQAALPYASKPKQDQKASKRGAKRAVVLEPDERRKTTRQQIHTMHNAKRQAQAKRQEAAGAREEEGEGRRRGRPRRKQLKKRYVKEGQAEKKAKMAARGSAKGGGGGGVGDDDLS